MAVNVIKWSAAFTDRSTVLTTQLNSLADGSRTAAGSEIDNATNLDQFGVFELNVTFGSAPGAGATVEVYEVNAPDGTNYSDGSDSVDPGNHTLIAVIPVKAVTSAQRVHSGLVALKPAKTKWLLKNRTGQAFPASGSTLKLYTANEAVNT